MEIPNTFLFTAYYTTDVPGQVEQYDQGREDKSLTTDGKNAFFDIMYGPVRPIERLFAFRLTAIDGVALPEGSPRTIAVNLQTGMFEVDGLSFFQHKTATEQYREFQLIYFRHITIDREITYEKASGETVGTVDKGRVGYVLGWQSNDAKGNKVEKIIQI